MRYTNYLAIFVLALAGSVFAQTYTSGTGITGIDKLGAHQNGGRGCTGCHAPHSGGAGGGGNAASGSGTVDVNSGTVALWGQDASPLFGYTIDASGYNEVLPAGDSEALDVQGEVTGIMFCLSCHDGAVAKGGMMTNSLYEQKIGKLPTNVYGPNTIPTLLAADGNANSYLNDHPIGMAANLGAVLTTNTNAFTLSASNKIAYTFGGNTNYDQFVSNYGNFFSGRATLGYVSGAPAVKTAFVLCTTCHTPHSMYTASGTWGGKSGTYPTYFFLVAPYNPGSLSATNDGTKASSATQFCRACHFSGAGGSNEASGIMNVQTAF